MVDHSVSNSLYNIQFIFCYNNSTISMQTVVYNTPLYHLLFLSVLYSMYIIIKLLSYYYYIIIIFFPHERKSLFLYDPIVVPNKQNIINTMTSTL